MSKEFDNDMEKLHTVDMAKKSILALVDCDSFFVSCEQSVKHELKGLPVCVLSNNDGCVIARSKEAKEMGVRMGQPYFMAKKEFPKALYIRASHDLYSKKSAEVMSILKEISPLVEIYSIDEAFVDLSGLERLYKKNPVELAEYIRELIKEKTDIPVSIGLSSSKTLAKLASNKAKKAESGVFHIDREHMESVLRNTNVSEIWGIGRKLSLLMHKYGIITAFELVSRSDAWLNSKMGIRGLEMKHELLGEAVSPVSAKTRMPKSIQHTSALVKFSSDKNALKNEINYHVHRACVRLRSLDSKCKSVGLMLRTKDFKIYYDKKTLLEPIDFEIEISEIVLGLLDKLYDPNIIYRSTGVVLENFIQNNESQLSLFADNEGNCKKNNLSKAIDKLEYKFGKDIIQTGFVKKELEREPFK